MINTVLSESDELIYKAAASCEKVCHIVHWKDGCKNDLGNQFTMTQLRSFYKQNGFVEDVDYTVELYKQYETGDILIRNMQSMINRLYNLGNRPDAIKFGIGQIQNVQFWLSNSDRKVNFRFGVVTIPGKHGLGYKEGRGPKPKYIVQAREFIQDVYGAKECTWGEADDLIAANQREDTVLSSLDKDLLMIPGVHYNPYYDVLFHVPEGVGGVMTLGKTIKPYGLLAFYSQLLCGDDIDNIPGCLNIDKLHHKNVPNFTIEYAAKFLQTYDNGADTEESYFNAVATVYQNQYQDDWVNALMEVADLIWICRSKDMTGRQYLKSRSFI